MLYNGKMESSKSNLRDQPAKAGTCECKGSSESEGTTKAP